MRPPGGDLIAGQFSGDLDGAVFVLYGLDLHPRSGDRQRPVTFPILDKATIRITTGINRQIAGNGAGGAFRDNLDPGILVPVFLL